MTAPVLAKFDNGLKGAESLVFKVEGGLHYIRGNSAPHFSLTASGRDGRSEFGGCCHDVILKHFPQFADLSAMHLSDMDGAPMHAEANGWYDLAGALGGGGEHFHVGNSDRHFPIEPGPATPWKNTEYRKPTQDECLQIWANHVRLPIAEARQALEHIKAAWNYPDMRRRHAEFIEAQRPRWKREAEACIAKHSLLVYGDPWKAAA